jgi:dienelactone hydrolase
MKNTHARFLLAVTVLLFFIFGTSVASVLDSNFGKTEVKSILIRSGEVELSATLYRPYSASSDNPSPAIVVTHGISSSKEMMSSIGLELSRRGFVTLCLDLYGHGKSGGTLEDGEEDPSFGLLSAVQYIESQPYVNSSKIGMIGHSLGAGAARAATVEDGQIGALVLIAGGLGDSVEQLDYGQFNSTFPKNLLVIVGKYDVLFNITELTKAELPTMFGTQQEVVPSFIYGNFLSQTARKLVTPSTTHLFEPFDPTVISEIVAWIQSAFPMAGSSEAVYNVEMIYFEREISIMVGIIGLLGKTLFMFFPVSKVAKLRIPEDAPESNSRPKALKSHAVWGLLNIALFLPLLAVGFLIPFPPLLFGRSIAWWMFGVGLAGLFLIAAKIPKSLPKIRLKETLKEAMGKKEIIAGLTLFLFLFTIASLLELVFNVNLRIITPIFRALTDPRRIWAFLSFLPFFTIYFLAEGLYLHQPCKLRQQQKQVKLFDLREYVSVVIGKTAPFLMVICLQYLPAIVFGFWVFPSFSGFIFEFLWLIVPIFILTTTSSWWFYKKTRRIGLGALFNTLTMAWVAAAVFPF